MNLNFRLFLTLIAFLFLGFGVQAEKENNDSKGNSTGAQLPGCNINAGGDLTYCYTNDTIYLYGSQSGIDTNSITWTQVPGSPTLNIVNPGDLTTPVTYGGTFPTGTYQFAISGTCEGGSPIKYDTVTINIMPAVSQAEIFDINGNLITSNPYDVCRAVTLLGTTPGAGETGYWSSASDPSGHTSSSNGDTLWGNYSATSTCSPITYYYTISNGGCSSKDTVIVNYDRADTTPNIYYGNRNICADTVIITGTAFGCNNSASWTINTISGAVPTIYYTNPYGNQIHVSFPPGGGTYQIIYDVVSNGLCPGGSDTVIYNICYSNANGIGSNEFYWVCDSFPDTVNLSAIVNSYYTYGNWINNYPSGSLATPVQTGTGQAYAVITDQSPFQYQFYLTALGDSCSFNGVDINCSAVKYVTIRRAPSFTTDSDTLNIFCQLPGQFYTPSNYISTNAPGGYYLKALQVPSGCTNIVTGNNYYYNSNLDFSCEGTYIFQGTTNTGIGGGVYCRDTIEWVVNVATLQNPNAGTDSYISICDNDTVPLVGNAAIDINGNINTNAIKEWNQIDANPAVIWLGTQSSQTVEVTGFTTVGVYMFEYSFSRDSTCYLADTMIVVVDSCVTDTSTPCPEFELIDCCELANRSAMDPNIQAVVSLYRTNIAAKYATTNADADPCCNPCMFPNDSFPIFIIDENNMLLDAGLYTISWSNDPTNNSAFGWAFPTEEVIVTVTSLTDSCSWQDTFYLNCCEDTVTIVPFCAWDPCDPNYNNIPFPLHVTDQNGNILSSPAYTFDWSNGYTGNATSGTIATLPISINVTNTEDDCVYSDTFDLDCCDPVTPEGLACKFDVNEIYLVWSPVADVIGYEIQIIYNDPDCCKNLSGNPVFATTVFTTNSVYMVNTSNGCFSWMVRSICKDGSASPWSSKECSCIPPCEIKAPEKLNCQLIQGGKQLSWNSISNAVAYEIEIFYNDPKCCSGKDTSIVRDTLTGTSYVVNGIKKCFSWKVRAICDDGTASDWSQVNCSCGLIVVGPIEWQVKLAPNPARNVTNLNVTETTNTATNVRAVITDLFGNEVYNSVVPTNSNVQINLGNLAQGMYIYKIVHSGQVVYSDKLIIQ